MISPASGVAVTALDAAAKRISNASNNIVNQNTTLSQEDGEVTNTPYIPRDVLQLTGAHGAVETIERPREPGFLNIYDPTNPAADENGVTAYPDVDVAEEAVTSKIATYDYKAALQIIKAEDERLGELLDIVG